MRIWNWAVVVSLSTIIGCAVEVGTDEVLEEDAVTQAVTTTRSRLEKNVDAVLIANEGRGCAVEAGRQVCVVTTAVTPQRVLRVGDPIPTSSSLKLCGAASCTPVPPPTAWNCSALAACLPLAIGCVRGEMHCDPSPGPFGGTDLHCYCTVLD